ncbi:MAG TPA: GNAT family N-acetyltransferase [Pirellulales bacterium]|nr:GNAT family N-acetyltransferase [Pirellulales bacterium]
MERAGGAIELKAVTEDDLELVIELIGELADYEQRRHEVLVDRAALREALFGPRRLCGALIAGVDGRPAGFALWYYSFSTFWGRPNLYIEDLYVRPVFRRRGVGRALLAQLAAVAAERGCGRLEWSVLAWNEPAMAFYRSIGAQPVSDWRAYQLSGQALAHLAGAPTAS